MIAPLSLADTDRLRAVVVARWPACAEAQGALGANRIGVNLDGTIIVMALPSPEEVPAYRNALEHLARILEDAGYAIERRGSARIVTGWVVISGRRVADMDPWAPVRAVYHAALSHMRAHRDRARQESIGTSAKYEHAERVNERARRST